MRNVASRRFLYLTGVLVAGVLLVLSAQQPQAHQPTSEHITGAVNKSFRGTSTAKHQTVWKCDSDDCADDDGETFVVGEESTFDCAGDDCGHGDHPPDHSGTWEYLGHRDWYGTTWTCPDRHSINPTGTDRWGALNKNTPPPEPGMPDPVPHCATLSVDNAEAVEGSPVRFTGSSELRGEGRSPGAQRQVRVRTKPFLAVLT